jgi:hypothetical protein
MKKINSQLMKFASLNSLLIVVIIMQLLDSASSVKRPPSPFRWSRKQNCYTHPAEPHISEAKCLKFPKADDITKDLKNIQNCKWHRDGICLECDIGFYLDFRNF